MNVTDEQQVVIDHGDGHAMVSAAPGSGKTTTMSHYVKRKLQSGELAPANLLVLMFNSTTSKDFKAKLASLGVKKSHELPIYTYHALALRLCNSFVKSGFMPQFMLEANEGRLKYSARIALTRIYGQKGFNQRKTELVDNFLTLVDYHKSGFLQPKEVFDLLGFRHEDLKMLKAYDIFESDRKKEKIMYFSDLLSELVKVLRQNPVALAKITNKKDRIVVDEFQDTNPVQYELVKLLAGNRGQLMVVGDVDQSIYEWRGADPEIMLSQIDRDFSDVKRYQLSYTFRYGPALAKASGALIRNNSDRFDQQCQAFNQDQAMDLNIHAVSQENEPSLVYKMVKDHLERGRSYKDIAIICRTYGAAGGIEMEILKNGIPCLIPKSSSILNSKEMNMYMSISRLLSCFESGSQTDGWTMARSRYSQDILDLSTYTKLNFIGGRQREMLLDDFINDNPKNLTLDLFIRQHPERQAIANENGYKGKILGDEPMHISVALETNGRSVRKTFGKKIQAVMRSLEIRKNMMSRAMTTMEEETIERRLDAIIGYIEHHEMELDGFVENIHLLREQQENTQNVSDGVLITSVHKAKGLEWPVIIMPTLTQGLFPFEPKDSVFTKAHLESERRLFFVAMTRAMNELHLLGPKDDIRFVKKLEGKELSGSFLSDNGVSQFFYEIDHKSADFRCYIHQTSELNEPLTLEPYEAPERSKKGVPVNRTITKTWADFVQ
jgi:DNA helicase-2/ATP-dependent DNA helicase PcrA